MNRKLSKTGKFKKLRKHSPETEVPNRTVPSAVKSQNPFSHGLRHLGFDILALRAILRYLCKLSNKNIFFFIILSILANHFFNFTPIMLSILAINFN